MDQDLAASARELVRFGSYIEAQIGNCEDIEPNDFMAFCLYLEDVKEQLEKYNIK